MPIVPSSYVPPRGFSNGHIQTIVAALCRRVPLITTERERIATPDGDFLDLDWHRQPRSNWAAILTHGLESDSRGPYVQGMAAAFSRAGADVLAWNFRGCSGEPNKLLRSYHSGETEDLQTTITHALEKGYERVALVGFSLGGNVTLKYLGDLGTAVDPRICGAAVFSVPCDLASSSLQLERRRNTIYMRRFMARLAVKVRQKVSDFPGQLSDASLDEMRTFREFDDAYTAPLHGFSSAEDYWTQCSSKPALPRIAVPALMVNAKNDPFLPRECFPEETAANSSFFHLEAPASGGHIGFLTFNRRNEFWSETRAVDFLESRR